MKVKKPTLVVNEDKVRTNIRRMKAKAGAAGATLRPHFKTHHSADIGQWFREEGIDRITCSSVSMAQYFAEHGWSDITIAFPYNTLEYEEINELAKKVKLNIIIESRAALDHVLQHVKSPLFIFLKIDVGTHRTGIEPEESALLSYLLNADYKQHRLQGLLGHAGHSYRHMDITQAQGIFDQSLSILKRIQGQSKAELVISYGDTPTCTLVQDLSGVDEMRPGNFAFYDIMQHSFGVCDMEDIAVCMVCPVVAIHAKRSEAVIYGGGVHFSKDHIIIDGQRCFGTVVALNENQWGHESIASLSRVSQEHGIVTGTKEYISSLKIGQLVAVLPVHSCLTADLQGHYLTLEGQKLLKQNRV